MLPSTSFLVVSGIVNRSPSLWSQGESVRPWQTILESFLWPVSATLNETSRMQLQHCGGESPVAKDGGKNKSCSHQPLSLWSLGELLDAGRQVTKVSCGASVATPNETRTMQCAETPVAKDQKLQPSISLLVVFERINEILADNYREFPVVNQWQSLRKPA